MTTNTKSNPAETVRVNFRHPRLTDRQLVADLLLSLTAAQVLASLMQSQNGSEPFLAALSSGRSYELVLQRTQKQIPGSQTMAQAEVQDNDILQVELDGQSAA